MVFLLAVDMGADTKHKAELSIVIHWSSHYCLNTWLEL